MTDLIRQQLALHPSIMPQDVIKMCFQAAYGAEHLLTDMEKVKGYFMSEYENCEATNAPIYELIAPEVCRVNLTAWKKLNLPPEWLFNLFVTSASVCLSDSDSLRTVPAFPVRVSRPRSDGEKQFSEYIDTWSEFARENGQALTFSFENFQTVFQEYLANCKDGKPQAVHHSQHYRDNEKPAYRVISGAFVRLVPILAALAGKESGVIAIDGHAASGKSTLAAGLKSVIGAEIVHMDDFFLPADLRTAERLNEPGGNMDYERFIQEVLPHLADKSNAFEYGIFNCYTMDYDGVRKIQPSPWRVVEGSYSQHPNFGDYMDVRVFSDVDAKTQMSRITARNGERLAEMFAAKWIPMEQKYFEAYSIEKKSLQV